MSLPAARNMHFLTATFLHFIPATDSLMYKDITFETLIQRIMNKVQKDNPKLDTREASIIYFAVAPAVVELQNMYIELDSIMDETFADTASREWLILRAKERGVYVDTATKAILQAEFNMNVPIGSRFSLGQLNYTIIEQISSGVYRAQCETEGAIGNEYLGTLIPIEYIDGLTKAELTEVLIPGEDDEDTEHLRQRYFDSFDSQAFGGNKADYKQKTTSISGVGGVKVYRAWDSGFEPGLVPLLDGFDDWFASADLPSGIREWLQFLSSAMKAGVVTIGGGVVKLVIIDSTYGKPSDALIDLAQTTIDPIQNQGEGNGLAPIYHNVFVEGVTEEIINIETNITLLDDWTWEDVVPYVNNAIDDYFKELASTWDKEENLIVRISQIETRLLNLAGVVDIADTAINGTTQNVVLNENSIPVRGDIVG